VIFRNAGSVSDLHLEARHRRALAGVQATCTGAGPAATSLRFRTLEREQRPHVLREYRVPAGVDDEGHRPGFGRAWSLVEVYQHKGNSRRQRPVGDRRGAGRAVRLRSTRRPRSLTVAMARTAWRCRARVFCCAAGLRARALAGGTARTSAPRLIVPVASSVADHTTDAGVSPRVRSLSDTKA